jgi:hypothetical protein
MLASWSRPSETIWGFDSFIGLPEAWQRTPGRERDYEKGHFNLNGATPSVPANVNLVEGFFSETLPARKADIGPIGFLHIDSDLYSSAAEILAELGPQLVVGSVVVFDELVDWEQTGVYSGWPYGEWKALMEWDREWIPLARSRDEAASIRITSDGQ